MVKNDFVQIKHMLEAARACLQFAAHKKRKDFDNNKMLAFAVIRALEIFGEAAANISKQFQKKHPQIAWRAIVGMRNRLIHAYFDIDYDIVWEAIREKFQPLFRNWKSFYLNRRMNSCFGNNPMIIAY